MEQAQRLPSVAKGDGTALSSFSAREELGNRVYELGAVNLTTTFSLRRAYFAKVAKLRKLKAAARRRIKIESLLRNYLSILKLHIIPPLGEGQFYLSHP